MTGSGRDRFPRQSARTQRFTLGRPRDLTVAADGSRVLFRRSGGAEDPVHLLWSFDVDRGEERLLADPAALADVDADTLPSEERARRERLREAGSGIVSFAGDRDLNLVAFALGGRLHVADVATGAVRRVGGADAVYDPRPDPTARRVAYVREGALWVVDLAADTARCVAREDGVRFGVAEFVAAEEMGRSRGYWWSPDGERLAAARVNEASVARWWIANPTEPGTEPTAVAYPAAGTANADVTLWIVELDGERRRIDWDRETFPYMAAVRWESDGGPLTILVQSRDQRRTRTLVADPDRATTRVVAEDTDRHWVDLVSGVPSWLPAGRLVTTADGDGVRRVLIDGVAVSPPRLHVRSVVHVDAERVLVTASDDDPTQIHVVAVPVDGSAPQPLTSEPGVHAATAGGDVVVVSSTTLASHDVAVTVRRHGRGDIRITSHAATPLIAPHVELLELGPRRLRGALLRPTDDPGGSLPVLVDPYGGPHAQRVLRAHHGFLIPQWFADHGFAVLIVDGRGTPARGSAWERAVHLDLAGPVLDDQVAALQAAADHEPRLDLGRVAIRGWSFGGYLAALAVLRRPEIFHAAVAGAPVTDWRLYDTHYTERYLGHPDDHPDAYRRSSLLDDAHRLDRPLMLIHGLADDNVVAAHSLRLSRALLEAGRPHSFLPLSEVSHMTPQEAVAENLLRLQLAFVRDALGVR
ncbi:MAG: prolyl oligopeptidase family serine peptidase [Actinomycetota bacterium]|nr:prolyl oligopeptidase family serine peptidase [Actinomycetota bacterium]